MNSPAQPEEAPGRGGVDGDWKLRFGTLHGNRVGHTIRCGIIENRCGRLTIQSSPGQAGQVGTLRAINQAGLTHYLAKPCPPQELVRIVREQLTHYVIEAHLDPLPYLSTLDPTPLLESLSQSGTA